MTTSITDIDQVRVEKGMPTDWLEYVLRSREEIARKRSIADMMGRVIERQRELLAKYIAQLATKAVELEALAAQLSAKDVQLEALVGLDASAARVELLLSIDQLQGAEEAPVDVQLAAYRQLGCAAQDYLRAQDNSCGASQPEPVPAFPPAQPQAPAPAPAPGPPPPLHVPGPGRQRY